MILGLGKKPRTITDCENCGTPLQGAYCYDCGQRGINVRRPVIGLAQDVLVETLSIDGKLARTIGGLLANPGKVAKEYSEGKRVKYSPPFRIYLFFSLVFFAVLFLVTKPPTPETLPNDVVGEPVESDTAPEPDDAAVPEPSDSETNPVPSRSETVQREVRSIADGPAGSDVVAVLDDEDGNGFGPEHVSLPSWADWLEPTIVTIGQNIDKVDEDPRLFWANLRQTVPRVLLLLPVIYTLLLLLFYFYKRGVITYDLLIISLYMHAALYFYLLIIILFQSPFIDKIPVIRHGAMPVQLWAGFQSFRVLAVNFGSKWYAVLLKGLVINGLYWTVAGFLIVTGMALSLVY